jgi:photosystem II stability/assembly factor-like uncharacterized protein
MRNWSLASVVLLLIVVQGPSPWVLQQGPTTERLRGVSAVDANVAWASGNHGTVLRTVDGGATWGSVPPTGTETLDFRDIEAFDASHAFVLAIGAGGLSRIYKTTNGGRTWDRSFLNTDANAFFDAIAFWDVESGLAVGDPVDGRFVVIRTVDAGRTWTPIDPAGMPPALGGDGAFAASGTCLVTAGSGHAWIGSGGGTRARVYRSADRGLTWRVADTPIAAGAASAGIFSLAFRDATHGMAVGGDYRHERESGDNLALTSDGGATWVLPGASRLRSFRSAVVFLPNADPPALVVAGPAGSDRSRDGGSSWTTLGDEGYHALSVARDGTVWAVGENGRIGRLRPETMNVQQHE